MAIVKQNKTDKELSKISGKIIELLESCNISEKYKIISTLKSSLIEVINKMGGDIVEIVKKDGN